MKQTGRCFEVEKTQGEWCSLIKVTATCKNSGTIERNEKLIGHFRVGLNIIVKERLNAKFFIMKITGFIHLY